MKKSLLVIVFLYLLFLSAPLNAAKLPEFTGKSADLWINSKPVKLADLQGNIVLVEIWTTT